MQSCELSKMGDWTNVLLHADERRSSLFHSSQESDNLLQKEQPVFPKTCSGFGQQDFGTLLYKEHNFQRVLST